MRSVPEMPRDMYAMAANTSNGWDNHSVGDCIKIMTGLSKSCHVIHEHVIDVSVINLLDLFCCGCRIQSFNLECLFFEVEILYDNLIVMPFGTSGSCGSFYCELLVVLVECEGEEVCLECSCHNTVCLEVTHTGYAPGFYIADRGHVSRRLVRAGRARGSLKILLRSKEDF